MTACGSVRWLLRLRNVRGAVTLRYAKDAVSLNKAVREYVPVLQEAARRIAARIPA